MFTKNSKKNKKIRTSLRYNNKLYFKLIIKWLSYK